MNDRINKTKPQDVVILIDIDDVLTYFVPAWVKWLNDKYGLVKESRGDCDERF